MNIHLAGSRREVQEQAFRCLMAILDLLCLQEKASSVLPLLKVTCVFLHVWMVPDSWSCKLLLT
jgi:hypothetical protein